MSPRAGITQMDIVNAAIELANTKGMKEVTMANLAKELTIKPPSLYNHIKGLSDLLNILTLKALSDLYEVLKQSLANATKENSIYAASMAYLTFAREQPGLYELTIETTVSKGEDIKIVSGKIIDLLIDILHFYHLEKEDTIHAIRGLRSILHGFASIENNRGFGMPVNVDESFHFLITTYVNGLQKH